MELTEMMKRKLENGREYRALKLEIVEEDESEKIVEGYATTFNEPYYLYQFTDEAGQHIVREQVDAEAFTGADMSDVIFQYDHEGRVFARLSNGTMQLKADAHGLKVRANLGGTEIGRNLYEEIKGGYTNKMSFGFTVADDDITADGERDFLRTIRRIGKLFDVSAVSYPQNNFTEITARNHCEGAIAEIEAERLRAAEEERRKQEQKENLLGRIQKLKGEPGHGN